MACGPASSWPCVGMTSTSKPGTALRRAKGGTASVHPIEAENYAPWAAKRETPASTYVFVSERLAPLSVAGYQRMVARTGEAAGFPSSFTATCCGILRLQARKRWPGHPGDPALLGHSRSTRPSVTRLWRLIALKASGRIKSPRYPCFDVRCGSLADIMSVYKPCRFTPESGQKGGRGRMPLCAVIELSNARP